MDRDFRVRCRLRILNFGVATGLKNQCDNLMDKTIPINLGQPNQELPFTKFENHYDVFADMNFPPEEEGAARGLLNHMKAALAFAINPPDRVSFCELERCGHRLGIDCPKELVERYEVEV